MAVAARAGLTLTIPIGGADMPVVISLLNSYSGLAAAATGFVLMNNVLIIAGSLVGASGIILTSIMCKAMNRSLGHVLFGTLGPSADGPSADDVYGGKVKATSPEEVAMLFDTAQRVLVVPGYGLAVAQAQHIVRDMANILEERGITVEYGIHPVAGRMPGHMNVLLAEADVPYEKLREMDDINNEIEQIDVCLVVGANDVVNPVARTDPQSPIAGMPIIDVDKARTVVVVKRSLSPGFRRHPQPAVRRGQLPDDVRRRQEGPDRAGERPQGGVIHDFVEFQKVELIKLANHNKEGPLGGPSFCLCLWGQLFKRYPCGPTGGCAVRWFFLSEFMPWRRESE